MHIKIGTSGAIISGTTGVISRESFTRAECALIADWLEGMNVPDNVGSPLRRLTDMFWALQNDTDVFIVTSEGE